MDQDPEDRADRPVDHEGRLLPLPLDVHHHRRQPARRTQSQAAPEAPADLRRDRLRLQRDADRPRVAAGQDVHDVVPVPRHAVRLHLDQQPDLVPAAAGQHGAQDLGRDPDAEPLRGDLEPLGHARADARDVRRLALRRHPAQRRRAYFKSWFPPISGPINILIVPLEILSQFLRLVSLSVRLFANMLGGPPPDPHVRLARSSSSATSSSPSRASRWRCSSTASSSCSSPTCRRSSSPCCPASTSAPRPSRITDPGGDAIHGTRR